MVKTLKKLWNQWTDFHELWYAALGPRSIIDCSNYDPALTLTYFTTGSNLACYPIINENETMIDSLNIIAACDLEIN